MENERIADVVEKIHKEHPDMGYRRIRDELDRRHDVHVNDKRVLRINRALHIKSTIKYKRHGCTRNAASPEYIAKNYLLRQFHSDAPNSKWLTDVTEFKYYVGPEVHKVYLSAILDLYDRRIVAYAIGDRNDNRLVFDTFDAAVAAHPEAHPLFHSDRGYQYTSRIFHSKLQAAKMKQSMSRVAHCIDNGPMEGFWGILKRERYYGYKFTNREHLVQAIADYIFYYNNRRLQRRLYIMTPMEFHMQYVKAA
ncbi:Transposase InsO and inactivated derivatives [Desulfosporosinus lacus DSM 15449]|uniref:Transposase InsO and inactivated derivatives n=1 Tax=Desulfosporosinus lacus DSM 15449 TaxID=1121420 RepID=A0A1M5QNX3_9FIRM|nr:Transposase InsO and inactivated derivatives [Desulfosporosinus lacus DSM 15449]